MSLTRMKRTLTRTLTRTEIKRTLTRTPAKDRVLGASGRALDRGSVEQNKTGMGC